MEIKAKTSTWMVIIILAVLLIGYLWYTTMPKNVPASKVVVVPADFLTNDEANNIKKAPSFGNLPVTVSGAEKSRPDPFAGF